MAQTSDGAKKSVITKKKKDPDFFRKIGALGGKKVKNRRGGFADPNFARKAAAKSHEKRYGPRENTLSDGGN